MSYDWRWLRPEEIVKLDLPMQGYDYAETVVSEGTIRIPISHEVRADWSGLAESLQDMFKRGHDELRGETP